MEELAPKLSEILKRASSMVGSIESTCDGVNVFTVEETLRSANSMEEDREKKIKINMVLNDLREYYRGLPASKRDADAQVVITDTQAYAYLTLVPPRSGGKSLSLTEVIAAIGARGITYGLNYAVLESACDKFTKKGELIYSLKIAECAFPSRGEDATVAFRVKHLDKLQLFREENAFKGEVSTLMETIESGKVVAAVEPAGEGSPGTSVRGETIPSVRGNDLPFKIGEGLQLSPNGREVKAVAAGCLVLGETSLDIIPLYVVAGNLAAGADLQFNGNILVTGGVLGPVSITCEDLFVQGNLEAAQVFASGDVFVGGGIVGKKTGVVEADGRVAARFVSDATLRSMGDLIVRNSITYSDVTTNGRISVISEKGAIVGGSVSALKGIVAKSVGSDFGTYTTTTVGKDFLSDGRLAAIERRIKEHEANLAKMEMIKRKLSEAKIDISKLPPEKQDIYISILQKELKAREELNSLRRGKERFDRAIKDFLEASIRVVEELHPPVRVQIGEAIQEIRERMEKVILVLDRDNRILSKKEGE